MKAPDPRPALPTQLVNKAEGHRTGWSFLLIFLALAVGIVVSGCLIYRHTAQNYRAEVERQLAAIAELKVGELTQWRKERLGDGDQFFRNPAFAGLVRRCIAKPDDAEALALLQAWLAKVQVGGQYDRVRLLDTQGVARVFIGDNQQPMVDSVARRIPEVLRAGQVVLLDFFRSDHDQRIYLAVLVPILDETAGDRPLGLLALRIDPTSYLYPFIARWPVPSPTAETLLVRREGNEAVFLNELRFQTNTALRLRFPLDRVNLPGIQAALGHECVMDGVDYRGEHVVAAVRTIPDSPWALVARMDTAEVYAPLSERLWQVIVLIGALLLGAGAAVGLVWRQRRIRMLDERVQSAETLRASETRYRRLFEAARDGVLILDAETGMVVDVNPFLIELLGLSREFFLGKRVWELGFLKDVVANEANFRELQQKGYVRYEDMALEAHDGQRHEVEFVSNVYLANEQKVIQCNIRDISERKQSEKELAASRQLLQDITDNSPALICVLDTEGRFLLVNKRSETVLGAPPERVIGQTRSAFQPQEVAEAQRAHDLQVIRAQKALFVEEEFLEQDGQHIYLTCKFPLFNAQGVLYAVGGLSTDITERKRTEESQARLVTAVEQAAEAIVITDSTAKIVYANPAFEKITGYTRSETYGQNPRVLKSGKQDAAFYRKMWALLTAGKIWIGHLINKRKDGVLFEEDATISPVLDVKGQVINYVAVKRDVTREMALEAQHRQAAKMEAVGRLAGGVAHDFNNQLQVILGNVELLLKNQTLDLPCKEHLEEIRLSARRSATLTQQLLAFSRQELHTPVLLDLNVAIASSLKMLSRLIGENIELRFVPQAQVGSVVMDPGQLDQILANLAVNARDAIPGTGTISIEAVRRTLLAADCSDKAEFVPPGDYVLLTVRDTGTGMTPEVQAHIFEPFFTTKAVGKGTGLGLAMVYGIVKQNHGAIEVHSVPQQGTAFTLYLPAAGAATPVPVEKTEERIPTGTETILLVEDEASVLYLVRRTLAQLGYQVLAAATPQLALQTCAQHPGAIHLLLTDVLMPVMSGKELAEKVRLLRPAIPVLFMSGYSADIIAEQGQLSAGLNLLQKPFTSAALAQRIRAALDAPSAA